MKTKRKSLKCALVCCLALIWSISAIFICAEKFTSLAYAEENTPTLNELCEEYTDSLLLKDEPSGGNQITEYENYINIRFDVTNQHNLVTGLTDEWIFKIVPRLLFEQQEQEFLYIGREYGFYFNYNQVDNTYFVYLMQHDFNSTTTSGHIVRRIKPLYYEQYVYDATNQTANLQYIEKTELNPLLFLIWIFM